MSDCKIYRLEIKRLRSRIRRLEKKLNDGRREAAGIIHQAQKVKSQHQPRGKWSFAHGSEAAAKAVLQRLR